MGWEYWESYRPQPRRPANGIKAQTQRGQFGKTWWASRWIDALEQLVDPARLARGRSYARSGQVVKLDVGREGVSALVQGSRPTPYQVSIHFRRLSDASWEKVADAMAAEALYAAKLLSGEMPEEIEKVFKAAGASLLPVQEGDLHTDCSCPDWANPCKHVAAVHYLLGERFDVDPFLMFEMRGRNKDEVAAALRARRAGTGTPESPGATEEQAEEEEAVPLLGETPAAFWSAPTSLGDLALSFEAPAVAALPIKQLGTPPFWNTQRDFMALMEDVYRGISACALSVVMGEE
jgi:uncharacterized Zn finger protein